MRFELYLFCSVQAASHHVSTKSAIIILVTSSTGMYQLSTTLNYTVIRAILETLKVYIVKFATVALAVLGVKIATYCYFASRAKRTTVDRNMILVTSIC